MWTHFWDMHSGGGQKLDWQHIFIEAPEKEAVSIFYARFHRNPHRVTCTCCGPDYAIDEHSTLEDATAYQRGCAYDRTAKEWLEQADPEGYRSYIPLSEYVATGGREGDRVVGRESATFIFAEDIKTFERNVTVPEEGYVWKEGDDV